MKLKDLIEQLQIIAEAHGGETEVRVRSEINSFHSGTVLRAETGGRWIGSSPHSMGDVIAVIII